jgi:hypothetical protein
MLTLGLDGASTPEIGGFLGYQVGWFRMRQYRAARTLRRAVKLGLGVRLIYSERLDYEAVDGLSHSQAGGVRLLGRSRTSALGRTCRGRCDEA